MKKEINRKKIWRKNNPEKERAMKRRYFLKHRKQVYAQTMEWRRKNPEKVKQYRQTYKERHPEKYTEKNFRTKVYFLRQVNLTFDEFKKLLIKQKMVCAICGKPESSKHQSGTIRLLSIDHCHKTNKVRGLLCKKCNSGLGMFGDDITLVEKAVKYLKKHD